MSQASTVEREMLVLINAERSALGLSPLRLELRLNAASEDHTEWMQRSGTFSHTGIGNSDPGTRMETAGFTFAGNWTWGENIAWQSERGAAGISDDVADLHQGLMNSPGHRANILNPDFELIGIGIERGPFNGWDAVTVTQKFATTDAAVQLDGAPQAAPRQVGSAAADQLTGSAKDDTLIGRAGDDTLNGGSGDDRLFAGSGADRLIGAMQNDLLNGAAGSDTLIGGRGKDTLHGGAGDDLLFGNQANDTLRGGHGNDTLRGGDQNDLLNGGAGNDQLTGGRGADTFVFSQGTDRVTDFQPGTDRIDLSGFDFGSLPEMIRDGQLRDTANGAVFDTLSGHSLTLLGVDVNDLTQQDLLF